MSVVRCETCEGTGNFKDIKPIFKMEGTSITALRQYEENIRNGLTYIEIKKCPNCGGSGCRWKED